MAEGSIRKSGWLSMQTGSADWRKYWFYLEGKNLCFTKTEGSSEGIIRMIPLGRIPLRPYPGQASRPGVGSKKDMAGDRREFYPREGVLMLQDPADPNQDKRPSYVSSTMLFMARKFPRDCVFTLAAGDAVFLFAADSALLAKSWAKAITDAWLTKPLPATSQSINGPLTAKGAAQMLVSSQEYAERLQRQLDAAERRLHGQSETSESEMYRAWLAQQEKMARLERRVRALAGAEQRNLDRIKRLQDRLGEHDEDDLEGWAAAAAAAGGGFDPYGGKSGGQGVAAAEAHLFGGSGSGMRHTTPPPRHGSPPPRGGSPLRGRLGAKSAAGGAPVYALTVYTRNVDGAGCTAPVSVMLHGEGGVTGRLELRNKPGAQLLPGRVDVFPLAAATAPDIGRILQLTIGHPREKQARWFLDKVEVLHMPSGTIFSFPCGRWLAADREDGRCARTLDGGGAVVWELQEIDAGSGNVLLLDEATGVLYSQPVGAPYPLPYGVMVDQDRYEAKERRDFFKALDEYLKSNQVKLKEVFDHFDTDRSMTLDAPEIARLVHKLLPSCTESDVAYIQLVLLGLAGDGRPVAYTELVRHMRDSIAASNKVQTNYAAALADLSNVVHFVAEFSDALASRLSHVAGGGAGVSARDLAVLLQELTNPPMSHQELRLLLSALHELDLLRTGLFTLAHIHIALRLAVVRRLPARQGHRILPVGNAGRRNTFMGAPSFDSLASPGSPGVITPSAGVAHKPEWHLERLSHDGRRYLLDASTSVIYDGSDEAQWPRPLGALAGGTFTVRGPTFFESLDAYLQSRRALLKRVFDEFDTNMSGTLEVSEVNRLVAALLPGSDNRDQSEVALMLLGSDAASAPAVTHPGLIAAIKDCMEAFTALKPYASPEVHPQLRRVSAAVAGALATVQRVFSSAHGGVLGARDVVATIQSVHPGLDMRELRWLLAGLHLADAGGRHASNAMDVLQLLRLVRVIPGAAAQGRVLDRRVSLTPGIAASTMTAPAASIGAAPVTDWPLEVVDLDGALHLHDRVTSKVYTLESPARWPQVVGSIATHSGSFRPRAATSFLGALDAYLKSQRTRLDAVFAEFDADYSGAIDASELQSLVLRLLPDATPADCAAVQLMLLASDGPQARAVTLEELRAAIGECVTADAAVRAWDAPAVLPALARLAAAASSSLPSLQQAFAGRQLGLDPREVVAAAQRCLKTAGVDMDVREMRHLLAALSQLDVCGLNATSLSELLQLLRLARVTRVAGGTHKLQRSASVYVGGPAVPTTALSRQQSTASAGATEVWELHETNFGGEVLLLDDGTHKVYEPRPVGQWPQPRGVMRGGHLVPPSKGDFFAALDTYLRTNQQRLQDVFDQFDTDRSKTLDGPEIERLVGVLLPSATLGGLKHVHVMLLGVHAEKGKPLSLPDLLHAIRDSITVADAARKSIQAAVHPQLARVAHAVAVRRAEVARDFAGLVPDGSGRANLQDVARLLYRWLPDAELREFRFLEASLYELDVEESGFVHLTDLLQVLRLLRVTVLHN